MYGYLSGSQSRLSQFRALLSGLVKASFMEQIAMVHLTWTFVSSSDSYTQVCSCLEYYSHVCDRPGHYLFEALYRSQQWTVRIIYTSKPPSPLLPMQFTKEIASTVVLRAFMMVSLLTNSSNRSHLSFTLRDNTR